KRTIRRGGSFRGRPYGSSLKVRRRASELFRCVENDTKWMKFSRRDGKTWVASARHGSCWLSTATHSAHGPCSQMHPDSKTNCLSNFSASGRRYGCLEHDYLVRAN